MRKLLSANFSRLFKTKAFWLGMGAMVLAFFIIHRPHSSPLYFEKTFFQYTLLIGFFVAIFTALFIGTDYHDGTIRNKIILGHPRQALYISNLIVCFAAALPAA